MVLVGVEGGVVIIQTSDAFHICNQHHEVMSAVLPACRVVVQDGGFDKGWKGAVMLQN